MKKYLIKVPEKYTKDGTEKTFWHTIGTVVMFETDGNIKIPAIGLNAKLYPVEDSKPTSTTETPTNAPQPSTGAPAYPELDGTSIPF